MINLKLIKPKKRPAHLTLEYMRETQRRRIQDPHNFQAYVMRRNNNMVIRNYCKKPDSVKDSTFIKHFGVSKKIFVAYFESLFDKGMSWKNYGAWHLDHIISLGNFDLTKSEDRKKANDYKNIRPMWGTANMQRRRKKNEQKET